MMSVSHVLNYPSSTTGSQSQEWVGPQEDMDVAILYSPPPLCTESMEFGGFHGFPWTFRGLLSKMKIEA